MYTLDHDWGKKYIRYRPLKAESHNRKPGTEILEKTTALRGIFLQAGLIQCEKTFQLTSIKGSVTSGFTER